MLFGKKEKALKAELEATRKRNEWLEYRAETIPVCICNKCKKLIDQPKYREQHQNQFGITRVTVVCPCCGSTDVRRVKR